MKVQCPQCKRLTHETTDLFNPDIRPNRKMIRLLNPWKRWHPGDGYMSSDLECPNCCAPLAPGGRLRVVPDDYKTLKIVTLSQRNQAKIEAEWLLYDSDVPLAWRSENEKKSLEERNQAIVDAMVIMDDEMSMDDIQPKHVCPVCGKSCKNALGLHSHMRSHA